MTFAGPKRRESSESMTFAEPLYLRGNSYRNLSIDLFSMELFLVGPSPSVTFNTVTKVHMLL